MPVNAAPCRHLHVRYDPDRGFYCSDCGADLNGQKWPLTLEVTSEYNDIP
jgi:hypothetical protein